MTHPFHPLVGQEFEIIAIRNNWGEDRVTFHDGQGRLRSVPVAWTTVAPLDPFTVMAAGRSLFRPDDLVKLVTLLQRLDSSRMGHSPEVST